MPSLADLTAPTDFAQDYVPPTFDPGTLALLRGTQVVDPDRVQSEIQNLRNIAKSLPPDKQQQLLQKLQQSQIALNQYLKSQ